MSQPTHRAIATTAKGILEEIRLPTQQPQKEEVLVKVEYSAVIAFDTYMADSGRLVQSYPLPLGLNASGFIVQVGPEAGDLKVGDRVTTFAAGINPVAKSMQEYALLPKYCVSKIPDSLSLSDAATIPDNFVTAYWALFNCLRLPLPDSLPAKSPPAEASTPILIYGSGTTIGQFLIQVLKLAGYTRILTTASPKHHEYLKSLGATDTFDYSHPDLANNILAATGGNPLKYVVDGVTAETTLRQIAKVVGKGSIVAMLMPIKEGSAVTGPPDSQMWMELPKDRIQFPEGVEVVPTLTFMYMQNKLVKETLMPQILPKLLQGGNLKPNRTRIIEAETLKQRAAKALDLLRNNKVSGEKLIIKIPE